MSEPDRRARQSKATAIARHYIRDLVYGANDGIITTLPSSQGDGLVAAAAYAAGAVVAAVV